MLFRVIDQQSAPRFIMTIREIFFDASLGLYLTFNGSPALPCFSGTLLVAAARFRGRP